MAFCLRTDTLTYISRHCRLHFLHVVPGRLDQRFCGIASGLSGVLLHSGWRILERYGGPQLGRAPGAVRRCCGCRRRMATSAPFVITLHCNVIRLLPTERALYPPVTNSGPITFARSGRISSVALNGTMPTSPRRRGTAAPTSFVRRTGTQTTSFVR